MRIVVTGGGTGGHVYPALEVARLSRELGHEIVYLGSQRGQEAVVCKRENILFHGFPSQPLYSLTSPAGWKAAAAILKSRMMAKAALRAARPSVVFSTGGYSAGPVVSAARSLKIPYMLHEANSAPGRSNLLFAKEAFVVGTVFRNAQANFPGANVRRTGMPIRRELREVAAEPRAVTRPRVLVTGGSQGSAFLNESIPVVAKELTGRDLDWVHVAGKGNDEAVRTASSGLDNYEVIPFFEGAAMGQAYRDATMIVCRSGGSLAEVALFGLPSILIPFPTAAADHQTANAEEFVEMGAAVLHRQKSFDAKQMAREIEGWLDAPQSRDRARLALQGFDIPTATRDIVNLLEEGAR